MAWKDRGKMRAKNLFRRGLLGLLMNVGCGIGVIPSSNIEEDGCDDNFIESSYEQKQKGFNYVSWWHDEYSTLESDISLQNLQKTGTEWTALLSTIYQDHPTSTTMYNDTEKTPNIKSLENAVNTIHALGMKVMLKPHIDIKDGSWRGVIYFNSEENWKMWFQEYTQFMKEYATFAEKNKIEQFCIGTELDGTAEREEWLTLIPEIRSSFTGSLTYAANFNNIDKIKFWKELDYIGIDAYFPLTNKNDPTFTDLSNSWNKYMPEIELLSKKYNKPIIFTEIGYRSIDGTNKAPWDFTLDSKIDLKEQADCYRAVFEVFWQKQWFNGVYFWNWNANPNQGGKFNKDYTPYNKPAEEIVKEFYLGD